MTDILHEKIEESEKYLNDNNIPYIYVNNNIPRFDKLFFKFIVPNACIGFVGRGNFKDNKDTLDKFYKKLDEKLSTIPDDIKIYIYLYNLDYERDSDEFKRIYDDFEDEFGFDGHGNGIELITNINQINVIDIPYIITAPHILRSLKLNPVVDILTNKLIICSLYAYQRFLAVSNDEEVNSFKSKYNMEILPIDEINKKYKSQLILTFKNRNTFTYEYYKFNLNLNGYVSNINIIESPNKIIDGVSSFCKICMKYFFIHRDEDEYENVKSVDVDTCFKCLRNTF